MKLFLAIILLSSVTHALAIPQRTISQISCQIDAELAKKWALNEIKYEDNKASLEDSIGIFFERTPTSELNRLCQRFLEQILQEAFSSISTVNPDLVQQTLSRTYPKVEINFVKFCEHYGKPLFAAACFKKIFLFGYQKIQVTAFHSDVSLKMFFPHLQTQFSNQKSKLSLIHEFLHYFEWDALSVDQHENPYRNETQDPIYACSNLAFPGLSMVYSPQAKESILLQQAETCRNHKLFRNR